jgi:hypothetical protein
MSQDQISGGVADPRGRTAERTPQKRQKTVSDFERAICYYTLPKITHSLRSGTVLLFAALLLISLAVLVMGLVYQSQMWIMGGAISLAVLELFGIAAFGVHAFLNDVRRRSVLETAGGVPNADDAETDFPDPFAGHTLVRHIVDHIILAHEGKEHFRESEIYSRGPLEIHRGHEGHLEKLDYLVDHTPGKTGWHVKTPQGEEIFTVKRLGGAGSFMFSSGTPKRMAVFSAGVEVAHIERRFSFARQLINIQCAGSDQRPYTISDEGIYAEDQLVGRIFFLRGSFYLDIDESHLNLGILGYFTTLI